MTEANRPAFESDSGLGPDADANPRLSALIAIVLAIVLAVGLGLAFVAAPASAGDSVSIISLDPDEIDADAGETVTIDLVINDHGDLHANGIDNASVVLGYDASVIEVTSVEHGAMLAHGDPDAEVEGTVDIDEDAGTVAIDQERTPSGDGARTNAPAATLTLEIAEDAEPTTETIEILESSTTLVTGHPQATAEYDADIRIEGGDPVGESDESDESSEDDGPDGVTLADDQDEMDDTDDADEASDADDADDGADGDGDDADSDGTAGDEDDAADTAADESGDDGGDETTDDSIPGFAVLAPLVAIGGWLGLRLRR